MKTFLTTAALIFTLTSFQNKGDFDNIVNALKQGNAAQFSNYFDDFIDLKLPEKDEIKNIGKTQATLTMKNFFSDKDIKGFDPTSQRELNGTMYLTGKMQGGAKNYNIVLLMKVKGDKLSIISARIS
ncbi:MAG TPA: DUF4783 domain-containing protein [Chitinophagaceae bacterium]|nr:DUF4783 domain-containing protein [Chitinophagaceae bacterium]